MKKTLFIALAALVIWAVFWKGSPSLARLSRTVSAERSTAADDNLVVVSNAASPKVAYGLARPKSALKVLVSVAAFESGPNAPGIALKLGLAADKVVTLSEKDAKTRLPRHVRFRRWP